MDGAETGVGLAMRVEENALLWLCLWLAGLTVLRLLGNAFSDTELFFDEAQYWFWSRELAFGYYSKPPLIGWIIRGATEICGSSEACIRAPSAIIHAITALVIFAIGRKLYDVRIGFWSGLTYATLPGVSLSASLISTDVALLFFVATALFAFLKLREGAGWGWTLVFGAAIGLGLLAKYAMVYFVLCLAIWLLASRKDRSLLGDPRLYGGLAIAAFFLAPNVIWNIQNGFATLSHTADNANWGGSVFHPIEALEFFGGQFGVFGPILFAALLVYLFRLATGMWGAVEAGQCERVLLAFSVPVIALMILQALLSRAHANWAAFAYIAATVLMTAMLLREAWHRIFRASLVLHLLVALLIPLGGMMAGKFTLPGGADPYARVLGWKAIAASAAERARAGGYKAVATDKRALAAELLYYLRDESIPIYALRGEGPPQDHFEMARPLEPGTHGPVLLVSFRSEGPEDSASLGSQEFAAGPVKSRRVHFYELGRSKQ